jgi:hypothetical protein
MSCEKYRDMMIEALYRELDPAHEQEFDAHVANCADCAAVYEELRATAARMNERTRPDPGEAYWNSFYARLEARMAAESTVVDTARMTARRRSYVSWGYRVAAAVAVLAMGVWLGRSTMNNDVHPVDQSTISSANGSDSSRVPAEEPSIANTQPQERMPIEGPSPSQSQERRPAESHVVLASADVRAREYIERSQVLLLALVNTGADTSSTNNTDFQEQRQRAGVLVSEASTLRDDLPGSENRRLRELVTDLQMILREIANLESQNDLDAVEIIRNRVDREGVLLQIDVEQMRDDSHAKKAQPKRDGAID